MTLSEYKPEIERLYAAKKACFDETRNFPGLADMTDEQIRKCQEATAKAMEIEGQINRLKVDGEVSTVFDDFKKELTMRKFYLKSGTFEVLKKQVKSKQDLIDDVFSDGSVFDVIAEFDDKAAGMAALDEKVNYADEVSDQTGRLICGKVYLLTEEELRNGEFYSEIGCDVAEKWEGEMFNFAIICGDYTSGTYDTIKSAMADVDDDIEKIRDEGGRFFPIQITNYDGEVVAERGWISEADLGDWER